MTIKRNSQVLKEHVKMAGQKILDIGCGDGALVRSMTKSGASVIGLEVSPTQLEAATKAEPVKDEQYIEGSAMDLPFGEGEFDSVIFFNSLHHIPSEGMSKALEEAARVIREGGSIYICEPKAEGPHFELMRPADDETEVRALAYEAIKQAGDLGLDQELEETYTHLILRTSFEAFRDKIIAPNPERAAAFAEHKGAMTKAFEELGEKTEGGYTFAQPMRVNLLTKKPA